MRFFYEESKTVQFIEAESSIVGARGWGWGRGCCFTGTKVQFGKTESSGHERWRWSHNRVNAVSFTAVSTVNFM